MHKSRLVTGPVFGGLFRFSLPMIIINILQMLFHMADTAILGIMAGDGEVAAVGACGSLISLIVCLVSGYSSAANVVISRRVGAQNQRSARAAAGTALVLGFLSGVILMAVVLLFSRRFLIMTNCQADILDMADLYMKIYFLGMPITMLYNFSASILRAVGDSVRPMVYMIIAGVANVGLNIVFVGAFQMTVLGVALATVLSNVIALVLILIALGKNKDYCKIEKQNLRLRKTELLALTNFVTCTMEVFSNSVRALKRPKYLLIVGVLCGFLIRSAWAWFLWPLCKTLPFLFICFPLSTFIGTVIYSFVYKSAMKHEKAKVARYDYA